MMDNKMERRNFTLGLVIFDGDDTLWETQILYDRAKRQLAERLESLAGEAEVLRLFEEIDVQQVATKGYSPARFPSSMVETYEVLSSRNGHKSSPALVEVLQQLGNSVFEQSPALYDDTIDVLSTLQPRYRLALVTKGDSEVQACRIAQTGLARFFDRIYIVPEKDRDTYAEVLHDFREASERTWVIGNSIRSDINPGLQLGLNCVLIERNTWHYEVVRLADGEVTIVRSLREAVAALSRREPLLSQEVPQWQSQAWETRGR